MENDRALYRLWSNHYHELTPTLYRLPLHPGRQHTHAHTLTHHKVLAPEGLVTSLTSRGVARYNTSTCYRRSNIKCYKTAKNMKSTLDATPNIKSIIWLVERYMIRILARLRDIQSPLWLSSVSPRKSWVNTFKQTTISPSKLLPIQHSWSCSRFHFRLFACYNWNSFLKINQSITF